MLPEPDRSQYRPLSALLAQHSASHPEKAAIVDIDQEHQISFAELAAAVDVMALQLAAHDVGKGSRVLLLAHSGIAKIIAWLGLWRLGAIVCPIDISFIRNSAEVTLRAIAPQLILADANNLSTAKGLGLTAPVLQLAEWTPQAASIQFSEATLGFSSPSGQQASDLPPPPAVTDLACMSCTSGTTGLPKVVVYDHLSFWVNGLDSIALLDLQGSDRMLEYRSLGWYSAQILSLMPTLQAGLTLHLARRFSLGRLPDWIEKYRITVCVGVPTVINLLINAPIPDARRRFSSLRAMTCSTAPLSPARWSQFEQQYGVPLHNLYGSSETGWISGNRPRQHRIGTVGKPVQSIKLSIVSESGEPCPPGTAGQLYMDADKVALGYLLPDHSLHRIRGAMLQLPDVVVMDSEGYLQVMGRNDHMISRGGVKLSPAEIEDVVMGHPDVLDAGVTGVPDPIYGQRPVCFVVPRQPGALDAQSVLAWCAGSSPPEKLPSEVIEVGSLPQSARGKLLRDRLALLYQKYRQVAASGGGSNG